MGDMGKCEVQELVEADVPHLQMRTVSYGPYRVFISTWVESTEKRTDSARIHDDEVVLFYENKQQIHCVLMNRGIGKLKFTKAHFCKNKIALVQSLFSGCNK